MKNVTLILLLLLQTVLPAALAEELVFDAFLGNRKIGSHRVVITEEGNRQRVNVEAKLVGRILFIPAFRWEYRGEEIWQNGCVQRITASTNENGRHRNVNADIDDEGWLSVRSSRRDFRLQGCARTFAHWDPSLIRESRLINTMNGKLEQTQLTDRGENPLVFRKRRWGKQHYHMEVRGEHPIDLWYDDDGRWTAMQTTVGKKRKLTYVLRD